MVSGSLKISVSLCGSVPRSRLPLVPSSSDNQKPFAMKQHRVVKGLSKSVSIPPGLTVTDENRVTGSTTGPVREICLEDGLCKSHKNVVETSEGAEYQAVGSGMTWKSKSPYSGHLKISSPLCDNSSKRKFPPPPPFLNISKGSGKALPNASFSPIIEPPAWAVSAKGDSFLEPVCDSIGSQPPVDLTTKSCFCIGRSPLSDIQLFHGSSSRRHALIFHHPNGSCYVVDCGSAHGTLVNGVRIRGVAPSDSSVSGSARVVLPHRVRRGAMIRFGGPGAPAYILKSFSSGVDKLVQNLKEHSIKDALRKDTSLNGLPEVTSVEADSDGNVLHRSAVVALNTRVNALGGASALSLNDRQLLQTATQQFGSFGGKENCKRAREVSLEDLSLLIPSPKKQKMQTILPAMSSPNIVSPTLEEASPQSVLVSPVLEVPSLSPMELFEAPQSRFRSVSKKRRVRFGEDGPELFFAPSVTPEVSSDEEDAPGDTFSSETMTSHSNALKLPPMTPRLIISSGR